MSKLILDVGMIKSLDNRGREMHYFFHDLLPTFRSNGIELNDNYQVQEFMEKQNLTPINVSYNSESSGFEAHSYEGAEPLKELVRRVNQHFAIIGIGNDIKADKVVKKLKEVNEDNDFELTDIFGGGSLMCVATTTYEKIVSLFGVNNLEESGDGKVRGEWQLIDTAGNILNIYDWKEDIDFEDVTDWHIGGSDKKSAERLKSVLEA